MKSNSKNHFLEILNKLSKEVSKEEQYLFKLNWAEN